MKCPDKELLSAFFDNEVPSPYREVLEDHIRTCDHCSSVIHKYAKMHEQLLDLQRNEIVPEVNKGVLEFCEKKLKTMPTTPHFHITWPVLAAAAAFMLFIGIGLSVLLFTNRTNEIMVEVKPATTVSEYSLSEVVDYLSKQQNSRTIEIPGQLPIETSIQPTIVREADFNRSGK